MEKMERKCMKYIQSTIMDWGLIGILGKMVDKWKTPLIH